MSKRGPWPAQPCECGCEEIAQPGRRFVHGHNGRMFQTPEEEFWARVDVRGLHECWPWMGTRWPAGYGKVGRANKGAHVVAYTLLRGPMPPGTEIDHRCYNPPCCNPLHLDAVTPAENMRRRRPFRHSNQNVGKTHCKNGHPFIPENTYTNPRGQRCCRPCHNAYVRRWNKRRAELSA